uniref:RGS domain-containing protein n=1 Tax=Periophthalmus magnuspinnatus TaxID=409849 RepID=A0A3B4A3F6_9GOBI
MFKSNIVFTACNVDLQKHWTQDPPWLNIIIWTIPILSNQTAATSFGLLVSMISALKRRGTMKYWHVLYINGLGHWQPRFGCDCISFLQLCSEELSQWSHSLEKLLASKYGLKIFQAFLKSEYSDENIEFWLVCEDYKKIKSSYRMSSRARRIFKRYIQVEAPKEINIDQKTREIIHQNIAEPIATCFDEAQKIVFGLMEKDSYPRFLRSSLYRSDAVLKKVRPVLSCL